MNCNFDLLTTVEYGGCSAKMPPGKLAELLGSIPLVKDKNILVDIDTHDDAGVYKINDDLALIVTTDFFPPVCSNAYEFGQIAAANSLSDVYAMGGKPLLALNLTMFPSATIPAEVLRDILLGGQDKINESGAFTMGGHTIEDNPPKYGLAVVGTIHPDKLITNSGLKPGQKLILSKAIGSGTIIAAHKLNMADEKAYRFTLDQMKQLNDRGAEVMVKHGVTGATDITGFGLLGHALKMAQASEVSIRLDTQSIPAIPTALSLLENGCIPGAAFRNRNYVENHILTTGNCTTELLLLSCDAQTSGGLLMGVDPSVANEALGELKQHYPNSRIIGEVLPKSGKAIYMV